MASTFPSKKSDCCDVLLLEDLWTDHYCWCHVEIVALALKLAMQIQEAPSLLIRRGEGSASRTELSGSLPVGSSGMMQYMYDGTTRFLPTTSTTTANHNTGGSPRHTTTSTTTSSSSTQHYWRPTTFLWKCVLSLVVWTVAVMAVQHVRIIGGSGHSFQEVQPRLSFWQPPPPQQQQQIHAESNAEAEVADVSAWSIPGSFRLDLSTEDNYQIIMDATSTTHAPHDVPCGHTKFADIRKDMDYSFHKVYNCQRQLFQDTLIESMLLKHSTTTPTTSACEKQPQNWIVFTAGVMGAGKSWTLKHLADQQRFPLDAFVTVDPDRVRRKLPEFDVYVRNAPEKAGEWTRKESGMLSEILTEAALRQGANVLVDGSLRNATYYASYFQNLRVRYPHYKIGILHVTAPREAVLERAMVRFLCYYYLGDGRHACRTRKGV